MASISQLQAESTASQKSTVGHEDPVWKFL